MNVLPKIKKCPCCNSINLVKINGVAYENKFASLSEWILKKIFNCRKCRVELGLFVHNNNHIEKLIWIDYQKCEETQLKKLNKLQKNKVKYRENNKHKDYLRIINEIQNVQNQIRIDQTNVKIKAKIQNIGMFI
jgi:hypothetical protein|tara:strand:- start:705 stop:1106 length:402 start_codon:yes stop_codon:yes gene_type:complete